MLPLSSIPYSYLPLLQAEGNLPQNSDFVGISEYLCTIRSSVSMVLLSAVPLFGLIHQHFERYHLAEEPANPEVLPKQATFTAECAINQTIKLQHMHLGGISS